MCIRSYIWKFNLAFSKDVLLDPTNILFIDPNHEINVTSPENVLHPRLLNGPLDRHLCLVKDIFLFIRGLVEFGKSIRVFMKEKWNLVEGFALLDNNTHVQVELEKRLKAK